MFINSLRPIQNGCHFPDDIFKCIFLTENVWISFKNSLKFVPEVRISNIQAFAQIMAWLRPGDKPLSEPMMVNLLTHICVTQPQWINTCKTVMLFPNELFIGWLSLHHHHFLSFGGDNKPQGSCKLLLYLVCVFWEKSMLLPIRVFLHLFLQSWYITSGSAVIYKKGTNASEQNYHCNSSVGTHYIDFIMITMASQITGLTVVYSTVYSDADQRKHQSSASLAFVWGIHRRGEFPAQRASYAENVSIWWRHHAKFPWPCRITMNKGNPYSARSFLAKRNVLPFWSLVDMPVQCLSIKMSYKM